MNIKDKVILITGACGVIASKLVTELDQRGAVLLLVDSNESKLKEDFSKLSNPHSRYYVTDLSDAQKHNEIVKILDNAYGKLDCAIHLAYPRSAGWGKAFGKLDHKFLLEDLNKQLALPILFSQVILKFYDKQNYGNLIHVSSVQGVAAPKFEHYEGTSMVSPIEYTAVKTALIAITKYLAKLYKNKNIRVNCVSPGGILDNQPDSFLKKYKSSCVNKGMLDSEDLIGSFLFLISDESRYITGQNIIVDDGWSL